MYKGASNVCWKCEQQEGTFYCAWWTCKKVKTNLRFKRHTLIQTILKINIHLTPGIFLLGLIDKQHHGRLFQYMRTATITICIELESFHTSHYGGMLRDFSEMAKIDFVD